MPVNHWGWGGGSTSIGLCWEDLPPSLPPKRIYRPCMHDCGYPAIRPLSAGLEYRIAFSRFLWLFAKVFSAKFGGVAPLVLQNEQSANVFSTKIVFFTNSRKFSLSKVSRYTVFTLIQASYFPKHLLVSMHVGPKVSPG